MTLVELMVCLAIFAILLGMSSAFFSDFQDRFGLSNATFHLSIMLKNGKEWAKQENSQVLIKFFDQQRVELWGARTVGFWHCDDLATTGAFGLHGQVQNGFLEPGKIQKSLGFEPGQTKLDCGIFQRFGPLRGFSLRFWVYPGRCSENQTLFQISDVLALRSTMDNGLVLETPTAKIYGQYTLPWYQWILLEVRSAHDYLSIWADERLIAQGVCRVVVPAHSRLLMGTYFRGRIDQIQLLSWTILDEFTLPDLVMLASTPSEIWWNSQGYLDGTKHTGSIQIVLQKTASTEKAQIAISEIGVVQHSIP